MAEATGKVTCGGKAVSIGSVMFSPIGEAGDMEPGKSANAVIAADGTFVLTTFDSQDGAIVGKHKVTYWPPEGSEDDEGPTPEEGSAEEKVQNAERRRQEKAAANACILAKELEVEVTADGPNDFTIELTPAGKSRG